MTELFSTVLRMSGYGLVAALIASLAVLLLSRARCSKTALLLLFAVAALRLVCPWSPPSPVPVQRRIPAGSPRPGPVQHCPWRMVYVDPYKTVIHRRMCTSREDFDRVVAAGVALPTIEDAGPLGGPLS